METTSKGKNDSQRQAESTSVPLGDPDTSSTRSDLEMLLSQLEEFNQAITVLAAEKADLSIQLELAWNNLSNADTMIKKMKNDHSVALQEKSKLLGEIDQLVDVINNERIRFKESNEQSEKEGKENKEYLRKKELEIETYKTDLAKKVKCIEQLNIRTDAYQNQIEEIKSFTDELRVERSSRDQKDSLIVMEKESEISKLKEEIIQLNAINSKSRDTEKNTLSTTKGNIGESATGCSKKQHLKLIRDIKLEEYELKIKQLQLKTELTNNSLKQMLDTNKKQQDIISSLQQKLKEKDQHISKFITSKEDWEKTISKLNAEVSSLHRQLNELTNSETREKLETELERVRKKALISEKLSQEYLLEKQTIDGKNKKLEKVLVELAQGNNKLDLQIKKQRQNCKKHNSENRNMETKIAEYESVMQTNSKEIKKLLQKQKNLQRQLNCSEVKDSLSNSRPNIALIEGNSSQENLLLKEVNQLRDSYDEIQSLCKHLEHKLANERLEEHNVELSNEHLSVIKLDKSFHLVEGKETHKSFEDRILSLENELLEARTSVESMEKLNNSFKLDLEKENKMRIHEGEESQKLIQESRAIIGDLSLRARQAEDEQNHSLRVIFQLSQRLSRSIQDYKHLEEISMTRCQELALEAKAHS